MPAATRAASGQTGFRRPSQPIPHQRFEARQPFRRTHRESDYRFARDSSGIFQELQLNLFL